MKLTVKRWFSFSEEYHANNDEPLRKVAVVAVVENPYAGRFVEDLSPMIDASVPLGQEMALRAIELMHPYRGASYGKGGIAGIACEQEHVNALLTTKFAEPLRRALDGGKAWISSFTKRGAPGSTIDIPLAHKDALYVRSHYDGVTLTLHDAPQPNELAVIVALANRGRIGARVGGLRAQDVKGVDGLT